MMTDFPDDICRSFLCDPMFHVHFLKMIEVEAFVQTYAPID